MQSFVCGTRLCFGADAPAALAGLHAERVLLVTDPYFAENGTAARYAAAFPGAQVEIFSDVAPDPPLSLVAQGVARLQALRPDTVLALGGGSAIDCAKGIAALGGLPVRLVAVPTTSGSGSEVTSFAILTLDGVKHPLVDPALRPELAILDPALLEALPPRLIAESGMDAVSHCVEAAAAREANPVTDALAHSACRTLLRLLPRSFAGETAVSIWRPPWRRWPLTMRASAPATRWLMPSAGASMWPTDACAPCCCRTSSPTTRPKTPIPMPPLPRPAACPACAA